MSFTIKNETLHVNKELPDVSKAEAIDIITIDDNDFENISTNLSSSSVEEIESPRVNLELLEKKRIETIEIDDDGQESLNHKIVYNFPNLSPLLSCKVCNFKARQSQLMITHLTDIHSSKFMYCNECDFKGTTLNSLARHWMKYHRSFTKNPTLCFSNKEQLAVSFGQTYFCCTVCKFKTVLQNNLIDHLIENHTIKAFVCDLCPFSGDSADALDKHNESKHPPRVYVISENETDQNHDNNSTSSNESYNYECQRCKYKTNMQIALIRHMYSAHRRIWVDDRQDSTLNIPIEKEKKFTFFCNFCSFKTDSKNQLYLHKEQVHQDGKIFLCTLCKFQSPLMSELKEHLLKKHAKNSPFTCATCNFNGRSQNDLNTHIMLKHKTEKHYTCTQCIFITKSENDLKNHLNKHNIPKCKICSYSAPDKASLDRHTLLAHVSGKPFTCKYCAHFSPKRGDFYEHVMTKHLDIKSFPCRLCNHVSETDKDFDKHLIEVHVKELQFSCDRCKYRTNVKTELTQHLQTLHGFVQGTLSNKVIMGGTPDFKDSPFSCNKCQFKTNLKSSLTHHLQQFHQPLTDNIKIGEVIMGDVFVCNVCGFKTIGRNELQQHMQNTHITYNPTPEQSANEILYRIFSCEFCDYKTDQKTDLDNHKKKFHLNCNKVTTVIFTNQDTIMPTNLNEDKNTCLTTDTNTDVSLNQVLAENSICNKDENTDNHDSIEANINSNETKVEKLEIDEDLINNSDQKNKVEIFYCRGCDFKTNRESDLYPHVLETHINPIQPKSTTLFNCNFCDFISDQECDLKTHSVKHHNSKINSVKEAPCQLDKDEIIVLEDDDDIFFCSFCKFKTTEKKDLNDHMLMMHKLKKENNSNECEIITIDDEEDCINVILSTEKTMIESSTEKITTTNNSSIKQEVSIKTEYEVGHLELDCSDRIQNGLINTGERAVGHIKIEVPNENTLKCTELTKLTKLPDIKGECLSNSEQLMKNEKTYQAKLKLNKGDCDYSCGLCPFKTKSGNVLELHELEFHNYEPVKGKKHKIIETSCSLCNFQSNNTRDLNMHIITVHWKQKVLLCDKCEYYTSKEDELLEHYKVCHKNKMNKTLECYVCKYQANNIKELKKHLITCRKSSKSFSCNYCNFQTLRKVDLMIHLSQFHSRDKLFSCNDCGYYTKHPNFLKTHIKNKHTKHFCCSYCGFKTKSINNLKTHVANLHKKKKLFTCDLCNCDMRLKSLLLRHLKLKHKELF